MQNQRKCEIFNDVTSKAMKSTSRSKLLSRSHKGAEKLHVLK